MVHCCEAALLDACSVVCVEKCPWCGVGFGMDVCLLGLKSGFMPVLCEYVRVMCSIIGSFRGSVCCDS